ncbi:membrane protein [Streptomyces daqingensis]|uniref:Membrane protein n=1 Tax=Streptomyces daqingensis TaxID=1472640 RepID=A0ABQ2MSK6_9ACTN|nr:LytR C-terminal domain-containing protein [Streptomyces daqingensis]GGO57062.1 membrane protein [Streptomyces daqingensis]
MSMLTPPGMGGKYRITGNRYPRMRRPRQRRRIVLASIATVCALSLAAWGTLQLIDIFSGGSSASASSGQDKSKAKGAKCTDDAKTQAAGKGKPGDGEKLPEPDSVKVNVLNATDRSGLAKSTADELKKRGFKIGEVANAPGEFDGKVKETGVVLGAPGEDGVARLKVLGTQLDDADTRFDERKGDDVDLIIGDAYKKLAKKKDAEDALKGLSAAGASPSGRDCSR